MSLCQFGLADASIAQIAAKDAGKKAPARRTATALADPRLAPEPR
ncbi:hypothetical protein [Sphingomonas sp.]|nr:hypothetical protein [Sphingomonas sp.]